MVCLVWLLCYLVVTWLGALAECGAFAEGRVPAEEGVQIAEAADHPLSRVMAYRAVGFLSLRQGNLPQAISVLEQALDLAQRAHIQLLVSWVAAALGAAYALAGRIADALLLLAPAVEQAAAMRFMLDHALLVLWLSEVYLLAGQLDEASTQAQRALEFSRACRARATKPMPCCSLARLRHNVLRWRPYRPKPTTSKPSPWLRS